MCPAYPHHASGRVDAHRWQCLERTKLWKRGAAACYGVQRRLLRLGRQYSAESGS